MEYTHGDESDVLATNEAKRRDVEKRGPGHKLWGSARGSSKKMTPTEAARSAALKRAEKTSMATSLDQPSGAKRPNTVAHVAASSKPAKPKSETRGLRADDPVLVD